MTRFLLFALPLLLLGCGISKNSYRHDETSVIRMSTGPCFGSCPVYDFAIDGTGKATFNGKRFVDKMGEHAKTFSPEATNQIFKEFKDADFFDFQDEYTADVTDLPTTLITYEYKGRTKTVKAYYGMPESLIALIKYVHSYTETEGWEATTKE